MIKICKFKFQELNFENHWVMFTQFGDVLSWDLQYYTTYREVPNNLLEEGEYYQIGVDQSSSNTGLFIKNYKNTLAYMIEIKRDSKQESTDYIYDFEMFLHKIGEGKYFTHLIYERPIIVNKGSRVSYRSAQVLFQLEGTIRTLVKRYPEFKTAQLDYIENSSWRSAVILEELDDEKTRTEMRKQASAISIETIFPWTRYYNGSIGKDYDIYEAMGILFGWFMKRHDKFGRPYVRGDDYTGNIGGFVLPNVRSKEVSDMLKQSGLDSAWFVENPGKSIYGNLAAGLSEYKIKCVELSDPIAMLALCIECNIKWEDYDFLTVVLVTSNFVDDRLFDITGRRYHFVF